MLSQIQSLIVIIKKGGFGSLLINGLLIFRRYFPWPMSRGRDFFKKNILDKLHIGGNCAVPVLTDVGLLLLKRGEDVLQNIIFVDGTHYEKEVSKFLRNDVEITEKDVVFDIGGHVGYYTLLFAKLIGEKGKVVSFEPQPVLSRSIKESLKLNNITWVSVENLAVSKNVGELTLFQPGDTGRTGVTDKQIKSNQELIVKAISLDEYIYNDLKEIPSFVKMDIEGCEWFAFQGMHQLLTQENPKLLIEIHPDQIEALGGTQEKLINTLYHDYHYKLFQIHHHYGLIELIDTLPISTTWHLFAQPKLT